MRAWHEHGRAAGALYDAASPSIVWFWPILVTLACGLPVLRLGRPELDERHARAWRAWHTTWQPSV